VNARRDLAVALGRRPVVAYIRQAVVKSTETSTVTITLDGVDISGVRYYSHLTLAATDVVDVLVQGSDIRVLGTLA